MSFEKNNKYSDYSEALALFKKVYLFNGHEKFLSEYANSYIGRGENDIVRNDLYSECIEYKDSGSSSWKIRSPKNIFGIELEHSVNHKNHNTITSNLILNSGYYDLNRMMVRFAQIDVTQKSDEELIDLVKSILSKTNYELISEYNIKENPNGILTNLVIFDYIMEYLKSKDIKFPDIKCDSETGNIVLAGDVNRILINNKLVQYNNQLLEYSMTREFPKCKLIVDGIKGDNELFDFLSDKFTRWNNKDKEKNQLDEILSLALEKEENQRILADKKEEYAQSLKEIGDIEDIKGY